MKTRTTYEVEVHIADGYPADGSDPVPTWRKPERFSPNVFATKAQALEYIGALRDEADEFGDDDGEYRIIRTKRKIIRVEETP